LEPAFVDRIAVIGLGVIGGSLGLALKARKSAREVVGYDCSPCARQEAEEIGAVDRVAVDLAGAVEGAEVVILAIPVGKMVEVAEELKRYVKPGAIVTDTGSVKGSLVDAMEAIFHPRAFFVGGHPMAGSEKSGIKGADPYLLENAVYVLTPTPRTDRKALELLETLFRALGARVLRLDPWEHDLMVGAISHLPHLLAASLVRTAAVVSREHPHTLMLAAGGFRDTTRIASGDPALWRDILLANREALLQVLALWEREIKALRGFIVRGDKEKLQEALEEARSIRDRIPAHKKGLLPALHELVVVVPDRPGIIGLLGTALGSRGINIIDIEILRVREGEGGSIRLGFTTPEAASQAEAVLKEMGIPVRII